MCLVCLSADLFFENCLLFQPDALWLSDNLHNRRASVLKRWGLRKGLSAGAHFYTDEWIRCVDLCVYLSLAWGYSWWRQSDKTDSQNVGGVQSHQVHKGSFLAFWCVDALTFLLATIHSPNVSWTLSSFEPMKNCQVWNARLHVWLYSIVS